MCEQGIHLMQIDDEEDRFYKVTTVYSKTAEEICNRSGVYKVDYFLRKGQFEWYGNFRNLGCGGDLMKLENYPDDLTTLFGKENEDWAFFHPCQFPDKLCDVMLTDLGVPVIDEPKDKYDNLYVGQLGQEAGSIGIDTMVATLCKSIAEKGSINLDRTFHLFADRSKCDKRKPSVDCERGLEYLGEFELDIEKSLTKQVVWFRRAKTEQIMKLKK